MSSDGYTDPRKVLVTPQNSTGDDSPDNPIQFKDFQSSLIKFPSKPIYICEFLYGPDWKNKIKKDKEYTIKVINNKPVLLKIKKNFFFKKKLQIDLS